MIPSPESRSSIGSTSSSLLQRVKVRDQDAWQRLVRLYGPLVDFWVRRAGLQTADAEDVFQEVFHAVARTIGTFHKDRPGDTFRGWLRTITRSKVADYLRRLTSQPQVMGGSDMQQRLHALAEDSGPDVDEVREIGALRLRALEFVRTEFTEKSWQMFWRVTVEGHEVKDVARELGVTPSAIRLAKSRVLRRLREEMEVLYP